MHTTYHFVARYTTNDRTIEAFGSATTDPTTPVDDLARAAADDIADHEGLDRTQITIRNFVYLTSTQATR